MAGLTCDLCGGVLAVGQGATATCTDCGIAHTPERLQEKLAEIRAGRPAAEPSDQRTKPPEAGPSAANLLEMAMLANEAGNLAEAENYCNRVIETDPAEYRAWLLKGRAAGWQSTLGRIRLSEAAHCFARAIEVAPSESTEAVKGEAAAEIKTMAVAVINLRAERFVRWPDEEETAGFRSDLESIVAAVSVLLGKSGALVAGVWEVLATAVNAAAVNAWKDTIEADYRRDPFPGDFEFERYIARIGNAIAVEQLAIGLSDEDDEADITRYENIVVLANARIDAKSYDLGLSGVHQTRYTLSANAVAANRRIVADARQQIAKIKERAEQAKRDAEDAARQEYWRLRPERHAYLLATSNELTAEIRALRHEAETLPGIEEQKRLRSQMRDLGVERDMLGRLKGKEKKAIQEQIDAAEARLGAVRTETAARSAELESQIAEAERRHLLIKQELLAPRSPADLVDTSGPANVSNTGPYAAAVDDSFMQRSLMAGLMEAGGSPGARVLTALQQGLRVDPGPEEREAVELPMSVFGPFDIDAQGDRPGAWDGALLRAHVRTPMDHAGAIAMGLPEPGGELVRIVARVAQRVPKRPTEDSAWALAAEWPLHKAEMYYLAYTGLVEDEDVASRFTQQATSVGHVRPGPLTELSTLADPQLLSSGMNYRALPGPGGSRVVVFDQQADGSGDLWLGWEIQRQLVYPLLIIYLHHAVLALLDVPYAAPGWLEEIGGTAPRTPS